MLNTNSFETFSQFVEKLVGYIAVRGLLNEEVDQVRGWIHYKNAHFLVHVHST